MSLVCRALGYLTFIVSLCAPAISQSLEQIYFEDFLAKRFTIGSVKPEWTIETLCPVSTSMIARRVLLDYGAMYSAHESVVLPPSCIQPGEAAVRKYQRKLEVDIIDMNGVRISLQKPAADKLRLAISEALATGRTITPLDGAIAGSRTYGDTLMLWNSRFFPALEFWVRRGRLSTSDRDEIARLDLAKKIEKVLEWESKGIFFNPTRSRSILTSTAPPGSSQHLALIAFDVVEHRNPEVQNSLGRHGWYQTIIDDPTHFTYLGVPKAELPGRGLRMVFKNGYEYWVPNVSPGFGTSSRPTN